MMSSYMTKARKSTTATSVLCYNAPENEELSSTRRRVPSVPFISDNGPQCKCKEFEGFASTWGFTHITSSPHYPQSNGLAEKSVHIAKCLMEKAKADHRDPYLSLLEYRNTPVDNFRSPAQLLMSRRLRSILPSIHQ